MMQEESKYEVDDWSTEDINEFIAYHAAKIGRVAYDLFRRQGFTTKDDIEQAIYEHIVKEWKHYSGKPAHKVGGFFVKAGRQFLEKEARDYMYFAGAFVYSPPDVRRILETSAWNEETEALDVDGRVDVQEAFKSLTKTQQSAVFRRFGLKIPPEETPRTEHKNVQRGVDRITHHLNRSKGKPRTYTMTEIRAALYGRAALETGEWEADLGHRGADNSGGGLPWGYNATQEGYVGPDRKKKR